MSASMDARGTFPWAPLLAGGIVVALALAGALAPHRRGVAAGTAAPLPDLVASRTLRFIDRPDGGVDVLDARTGLRAGSIAPGPEAGSFVRGVMRGLATVRRRDGVPAQVPFRLDATAGGRLVLADPPTGTVVDLEGFGPDNAASFAAFLSSTETAP